MMADPRIAVAVMWIGVLIFVARIIAKVVRDHVQDMRR